jgi:hypothetical protein
MRPLEGGLNTGSRRSRADGRGCIGANGARPTAKDWAKAMAIKRSRAEISKGLWHFQQSLSGVAPPSKMDIVAPDAVEN